MGRGEGKGSLLLSYKEPPKQKPSSSIFNHLELVTRWENFCKHSPPYLSFRALRLLLIQYFTHYTKTHQHHQHPFHHHHHLVSSADINKLSIMTNPVYIFLGGQSGKPICWATVCSEKRLYIVWIGSHKSTTILKKVSWETVKAEASYVLHRVTSPIALRFTAKTTIITCICYQL